MDASKIGNAINQNKNLTQIDKEIICSFIVDLNNFENEYGITIDTTILEENLKDLKYVINDNDKSFDYNENDNILYQSNTDSNHLETNWRYSLYKELLKCCVSKKDVKGIKKGLQETNGKNRAINEAVTNRILDLMLGSSLNPLDLEMDNLAKLQEIIGSNTIFEAYFKADSMKIYNKLNNYIDNPIELIDKMDKIHDINFRGIEPKENEKTLIFDTEKLMMDALTQKINQEGIDSINMDNYVGNIIDNDRIKTYSKENIPFSDKTDKIAIYFDKLIKGLLVVQNKETTRTI